MIVRRVVISRGRLTPLSFVPGGVSWNRDLVIAQAKLFARVTRTREGVGWMAPREPAFWGPPMGETRDSDSSRRLGK